jgi:ABC-type glutathione transport system ATPase component
MQSHPYNTAPMTASAPIIEVRNLVMRYPKVLAVDGVSLEIAHGECFGLLGPNGAGKTTTIEITVGASFARALEKNRERSSLLQWKLRLQGADDVVLEGPLERKRARVARRDE